jgi:hypothetical protein
LAAYDGDGELKKASSKENTMKASPALSTTLKPWPAMPSDLPEIIRRRAEEIYFREGGLPGRDLQNWVQAEYEIVREQAAVFKHGAAVVVRVDGVRYVGEYSSDSSAGYAPGEFKRGDPVPVRFNEGKMFLKRRNGTELETHIVRASR